MITLLSFSLFLPFQFYTFIYLSSFHLFLLLVSASSAFLLILHFLLSCICLRIKTYDLETMKADGGCTVDVDHLHHRCDRPPNAVVENINQYNNMHDGMRFSTMHMAKVQEACHDCTGHLQYIRLMYGYSGRGTKVEAARVSHDPNG